MSLANVRAALETALNNMSPAVSTAWENVAFTPPAAATPYQRAYIMLADPDNGEFGASFADQGIFQVSLYYPIQTGPAAAAARADLLRTTFKRGATFTDGSVTVTVESTPSVGTGIIDGDRWFVPVKIRFHTSRTSP